jgi:hypothetical protein
VGVNSGRRPQQHRVRLSANLLLNSANLLLKNHIFSNSQQQSATVSNSQQQSATVSNIQQQSATVSNSQQIDSAKFGDSATFSSVAKAQARHLPARDAAKKKDVHARAQARLPDLPGHLPQFPVHR